METHKPFKGSMTAALAAGNKWILKCSSPSNTASTSARITITVVDWFWEWWKRQQTLSESLPLGQHVFRNREKKRKICNNHLMFPCLLIYLGKNEASIQRWQVVHSSVLQLPKQHHCPLTTCTAYHRESCFCCRIPRIFWLTDSDLKTKQKKLG